MMKKRISACLVFALAFVGGCSEQSDIVTVSPSGNNAPAAHDVIAVATQAQHQFALADVRVTQGPFAHAQQTNVMYLLEMSPDRLLAPYLREAGLTPKAESYGNWENTGLDGHIGGHYVSALSLAWAATGDEQIKQRLDYMLNELQRAQDANGGYLGGIPDGKAMWAQIQKGDIKADLFSLNDRWVPLYNIDKIFHGLRDAYVVAGSEQAKAMLFKLGEWMLGITASLSDDQIQQMLYSEHGGLNDVFADMAAISGDDRYLTLAKQFSHRRILNPLLQHKDELTGLHANTQIPKIIGILKVAELDDDKTWEQAADFFWETVSKHRSVSIGGNSVREHFHDSQDFTPMVEDKEGPETCNTYNMLKLSRLLFIRTGETRYLDFYERASYNHILSSQHPQHGGLVYFTSMRPGHYRMYSSVEDSMWCCVGSGIENHSKYGELIYTHDENNLWINLFISSSLTWQQKGFSVSMDTRFPDDNQVVLSLNSLDESAHNEAFTLHVRHPGWLRGKMDVTVNGMPVEALVKDGYIDIHRIWQSGDTIEFALPAAPYVEQLPDGQDYYSILYGPVVLATKVQAFEDEKLNFVADDSRMGHIAAGPVCPPEALPVMLGDPQAFIDSLSRVPGDALAFTTHEHVGIANQADTPTTTLIPFFRLHDSRYQVYWPQLSQSGFKDFVADAKAKAAAEEALSAITVDQINPGEQQPEVEHGFAGENTGAGVNGGKHWRDATGWFSYSLNNKNLTAKTLRITYFKGDVGRQFSIKLNGDSLAKVSLPVGQPDAEFYTVDYPLTAVMQKSASLTLRFEADAGSTAGGIYGIRLLNQ